jgi:hypothetical protein
MNLTYNKSIKQEVLKELKKFHADRIILFFNFDNVENTGTLIINGYTNNFRSEVKIEIKKDFKTTFNSSYSKFVISDLELNDLELDMLLNDTMSLDVYFKGHKEFRFVEGNVDCNYWLDQIYVHSKNKKIKIERISFHNVQMIYKNSQLEQTAIYEEIKRLDELKKHEYPMLIEA